MDHWMSAFPIGFYLITVSSPSTYLGPHCCFVYHWRKFLIFRLLDSNFWVNKMTVTFLIQLMWRVDSSKDPQDVNAKWDSSSPLHGEPFFLLLFNSIKGNLRFLPSSYTASHFMSAGCFCWGNGMWYLGIAETKDIWLLPVSDFRLISTPLHSHYRVIRLEILWTGLLVVQCFPQILFSEICFSVSAMLVPKPG